MMAMPDPNPFTLEAGPNHEVICAMPINMPMKKEEPRTSPRSHTGKKGHLLHASPTAIQAKGYAGEKVDDPER
jgi:hypothetical protein